MGSMKNLREFLIRRRFVLGLSQRELARSCRLNAGTIASIESGRVQRFPSLATLEALARGLQVEMSLLVEMAREGSYDVSLEGGAVDAASHVLSSPGPHPLTPEERFILVECERVGMPRDLVESLRLQESSPSERRVALMLLQALSADLQRRSHHEVVSDAFPL